MDAMSKAKWCKNSTQYTVGSRLMLGPIKVGSTDYDGCVHKGDPFVWASHCLLPGVSGGGNLGHFATEEEAKAEVWQVVELWLKAVM